MVEKIDSLLRSYATVSCDSDSKSNLTALFGSLTHRSSGVLGLESAGVYWVHPRMMKHKESAGGYWVSYMTGEPDYVLVAEKEYNLLVSFGLTDSLEYPFAIARNIWLTMSDELYYQDDLILDGVTKRSILGCVRYGNVLVLCVSLQWDCIWLFVDVTTLELLGVHQAGQSRGNALVAFLILLLSKDLNFDL